MGKQKFCLLVSLQHRLVEMVHSLSLCDYFTEFFLFLLDSFSCKKNLTAPCPLGVLLPLLLCLLGNKTGHLYFPTHMSTSDFLPLCSCPLGICLKHTWLSALLCHARRSVSSSALPEESLVLYKSPKLIQLRNFPFRGVVSS